MMTYPATRSMRPEVVFDPPTAFETVFHYVRGLVPDVRAPFGFKSHIRAIRKQHKKLSSLSDADFQQHIRALRQNVMRKGIDRQYVINAFATVREAASRTLGMSHYDVQLMGGLGLYYGYIVEMQTGEGKTLTATLPAGVAALSGVPVHVLTVNDYLTQRDAEEMRPVYELLGLSVGTIVEGMSPDQRRESYACDIVYCSNKELAFDYMKDRIALKERKHPLHVHADTLSGKQAVTGQLLLRGLHFAIADEADSVLLDEARNPLIISGGELSNDAHEDMLLEAMDIAAKLDEGEDYTIDHQHRKIELTVEGEEHIFLYAESLGPIWRARVRAIELVRQALSAILLFERDRHYLLRDGKVLIIDENTGRVMPDRNWEQGLHQMVEIKEGCELGRPRNTLDKISFQNFFRRYFHVCGMTGTAFEAKAEFWQIYRKRLFKVPTNKPSKRISRPVQVFSSQEEKWQRIAVRIIELHEGGHPVLVGLRTVNASEHLSELLHAKGIQHELLNAKQDSQEADIVARAGQPYQITLATNMAGRGTDIKLHEQIRQSEGLHVILTELHDSGRIDRQLAGRCARQGDPGVFDTMISVEDQILDGFSPAYLLMFIKQLPEGTLKSNLSLLVLKYAQWSLERQYRKARIELLRQDEKQVDLLSFTGQQ